MPFCPRCRDEFSDEFSVCTDCNEQLVMSLESNEFDGELGDCYVCYNSVEANRIVALLQSAGMEPMLRDRSSCAFPTNIGMTNAHHIAIDRGHHAMAARLIAAAIEDGVINSEGDFVQT